MSQRLSYHQNVFDLLDYEPPVSAARLERLRALEREVGPLPAAVVDWYAREGVVAEGEESSERPTPLDWKADLWMTFTCFYQAGYITPVPLGAVCRGLRHAVELARAGWPWEGQFLDDSCALIDDRPYVILSSHGYGDFDFVLGLDGSDDPVVRVDIGGELHNDQSLFSEHVFGTISAGYLTEHTPTSIFARDDPGLADDLEEEEEEARPPAPTFDKPYVNGLWLRAPRGPFAAPLLDYLLDHFGEPAVANSADIIRHSYRGEGRLVRVTTDGELAAVWAHATDEARLAELARLLLPWADLRADTDAAEKVLAPQAS
jgi:hypothetical protein